MLYKGDTRDIWWQDNFFPVPNSRGFSSSSKKIIVYAIIGIIAVGAVSVSIFARPQSGNTDGTTNEDTTLQMFQAQWCGPNATPKSTTYIKEIVLESECEMPTGIAYDGTNVWYISAKRGFLGSFDVSTNTFQQYKIPEWPSLQMPFTKVPSWQISWTVKLDEVGNVWFTDQNDKIWRFNKDSNAFDMFQVPAKYPSTFEFDNNNNIYFIGINSQSIYFGDVKKMTSDSSDVYKEIKLPLDGFEGIDMDLVTSGLLVVDNKRNDVWVSLLAFQEKGQLFQYDIETDRVTRVVDLPRDLSSPVGGALDDFGNLWVGDHGTSIFFKYDPASDKITKLVTSVASSKIYGGMTPPSAYTWPYWLDSSSDGIIWFNEHIGNKIARLDPETLTLTEYWIPTQNSKWAACPSDAKTCGYSNALQFTVSESEVWFSEWTENKIARLDAATLPPFTVSAVDEITVAKGQSAEIKVTVNALQVFNGKMIASSTVTPNGMLSSSSGIFSEETISLSDESKLVSYTFTPHDSLATGQYVIMLGAENDDISQLKAVKVNIV